MLEGWNKHLISKAEKEILIKSVVQKIPTYTMSNDFNLSVLSKLGWNLGKERNTLRTWILRAE